MIWLWLSWALAAPVTPDDAVRAALAHDPALAAAEALVVEAEAARRSASGLRHNPELQARIGVDGTSFEATFLQPLSLSGEGVHAARSAAAALSAAEASRDRARLVAAADARLRYVDAVAAEAGAELAAQELALSAALREAAEARLAAGDAPELDVWVARLDEAAAAGRLVRARAAAAEARAALAERTGLPAEAELTGDPLAAAPRPSGTGERSDLGAAARSVDAARAAVARERAAALPEVGLGAFAADGTAGPYVGVEVPLWKRNEGRLGAARATLLRAEADQAALKARAAAEQAGAGSVLPEAERVAALPDVSADADAALAALARAYTLGELGILEVGQLRARVLEGRRGWVTARAAAAEARIAAMLASGDAALLDAR